jgi:alpha-galactosidase
MAKIVMIGAGGFGWTRILVSDMLASPALKDATFALVDIHKGRLAAAEKLCRKLIAAAGTRAKLECSTDRRDVLKGADAVVITILCGGTNIWQHDILIPKKYGVDINVGDTRGPSGILRAMRTIPAMVDIGRDVERLCPNAIVLNYTNPMAMVTHAMQRETGATVVGLCHSVQGTAHMLAHWCGVPPEKMVSVCAGLNHLSWFLKLEHRGKDLYPRLRKAITTRKDLYRCELVRNEMFLALGYYVTESSGHNSEYVPWFRKRKDLLRRYCTHGTGWNPGKHAYILGEYRKKEKAWRREQRDWLRSTKPVQIRRSHEYASSIVSAWLGEETYTFNGNVPNDGIIPNLPSYCVEVPVVVRRRQLQAVCVGDLPPQVMPLTANHAYSEMMAVEACLTGNAERVYQSIANDPLTAAVLSLAEIRKMVREMLRRNRKHLPHFKSVDL